MIGPIYCMLYGIVRTFNSAKDDHHFVSSLKEEEEEAKRENEEAATIYQGHRPTRVVHCTSTQRHKD